MAANNYAVVGQIAYKGSGTYNGASSTKKVTISFDVSGASTTNGAGASVLNDLNAVAFSYTAIPSVVEIKGVIENESAAANRKTFFYIPTVNYDDSKIGEDQDLNTMINTAYLGHVGIYLINTSKYGASPPSPPLSSSWCLAPRRSGRALGGQQRPLPPGQSSVAAASSLHQGRPRLRGSASAAAQRRSRRCPGSPPRSRTSCIPFLSS